MVNTTKQKKEKNMKEKEHESSNEKAAEVKAQMKIRHEGNVLTRVLDKSIKVEEKEVKEITLNLNLITGAHICEAEAKFLSLYPHQGGAKNYSTAFHFFLLEGVTGIPSDILLSIPTIEMSPVTAFLEGFLTAWG